MELKQPAAAGTLESGDILIELEPNEGKGLTIRLDSTVANQFGKRIKEVISETFAEMGVKDGFVDATDKGALDCTIRARVKAALIRALGKDRNKFLVEEIFSPFIFLRKNGAENMQKRLRRTMMFVPGNNPSMMRDAHIYGADSIMFDLEDSVSLAEKDAARLLVYNALKTIDYGGVEKVVRVNPLSTEFGRADVEAMVRAGADVIRMPKTETAEEITELEEEIERVEKLAGIPVGRTLIMAAIESALGVVNAYKIATASKRMMGIALGAEDYCANLKTTRSKEGSELLLARQTIVVAARAAGRGHGVFQPERYGHVQGGGKVY